MSKFLHILLYILLVVGLISAAVIFAGLRGQRGNQMLVVVGAAIFYLVWGAVHHILEDEFDFEVFLDYLLMAGLVVVVFFLALRF